MMRLDEPSVKKVVAEASPWRNVGEIQSVQGAITVAMPASVGEMCEIRRTDGSSSWGEVIGFDGDLVKILPYGQRRELKRGDQVLGTNSQLRIPVGFGLLGRTLNAFGEPIDELGAMQWTKKISVVHQTPHALRRRPIASPLVTGQKAIDSVLTLGQGQRIGLFAGSGVGKSTLLGQIARQSSADLNVVALIGERGREVLPFIQDSLGIEGMKKSVVIVATADESSLARVRAAESAVAVSSWFRSQGKNVMLLLDSITRFAMAQRDIGLLLGEPPTARGYTPSVFQKLAELLEQLGNSDRGSITGIISVLVDGDDMNDPIADSARSILDGHVVLDRKLANSGHFPAINLLKSASRLFLEITDKQQQDDALAIRQILATYEEIEDLVQVGAYQKGVSLRSDRALELHPETCRWLQQQLDSPNEMRDTQFQMGEIAAKWRRGMSS